MDLVQQTFEALLAVGHEQADTAQGEYNGSIEWRLSKVSMIHQSDNAAFVDEDVVDMEYAMNGRKNVVSSLILGSQSELQSQPDVPQPDDTLYLNTKTTGQTDPGPFGRSSSPVIDDDSKSFISRI